MHNALNAQLMHNHHHHSQVCPFLFMSVFTADKRVFLADIAAGWVGHLYIRMMS